MWYLKAGGLTNIDYKHSDMCAERWQNLQMLNLMFPEARTYFVEAWKGFSLKMFSNYHSSDISLLYFWWVGSDLDIIAIIASWQLW